VGSPCWWLVDLATYKKYLHRACGNSFSTVPREWEDGRDLPYTLCRLSTQQTAEAAEFYPHIDYCMSERG